MTGATATSLLVSICALAFWMWCLVDFSGTPEEQMRTFTRPVWIVVLVLGNVAGGVAWLGWGRPRRR